MNTQKVDMSDVYEFSRGISEASSLIKNCKVILNNANNNFKSKKPSSEYDGLFNAINREMSNLDNMISLLNGLGSNAVSDGHRINREIDQYLSELKQREKNRRKYK